MYSIGETKVCPSKVTVVLTRAWYHSTAQNCPIPLVVSPSRVVSKPFEFVVSPVCVSVYMTLLETFITSNFNVMLLPLVYNLLFESLKTD